MITILLFLILAVMLYNTYLLCCVIQCFNNVFTMLTAINRNIRDYI